MCVCGCVCHLSSSCRLWLFSCNNSFTGKSAEPNMYIWRDRTLMINWVPTQKSFPWKRLRGWELAPHRALRAILHVVDGELHLGLLVDVGLLEEGDAAEEDGVTGALWEEESGIAKRSFHSDSPMRSAPSRLWPLWFRSGRVWSRRPAAAWCSSPPQSCWVSAPKMESAGFCRLCEKHKARQMSQNAADNISSHVVARMRKFTVVVKDELMNNWLTHTEFKHRLIWVLAVSWKQPPQKKNIRLKKQQKKLMLSFDLMYYSIFVFSGSPN